jgi:phosphate transport system substrate-binding protein
MNMKKAVTAGVLASAFLGVSVASATITGAGATFPRLAYENWCRDSNLCSYSGVGSTRGITSFIGGTVDIAGTDATLTDAQLADLAARRGGVRPIYFPTLLGAITVPINVPGITGNAVKLDGRVVAEIFAGKITAWNDAKIRKTNPKLKFPGNAITVCVRSDGSGTSFGFSRYLTKVSPVFKTEVNFGQLPPWKAPNLIRQPGNPGVANCVKNNPNSIGYVDLGDAQSSGLGPNVTSIGRSDIIKGKRLTRYIRPSAASISAAGNVSSIKPDLTIDFSASPAVGAYPIVITTWILAYSDYGAAGRAGSLPEVKQFLDYAYSSAAQTKLPPLGFAPLPKPIVDAAKRQLATLK